MAPGYLLIGFEWCPGMGNLNAESKNLQDSENSFLRTIRAAPTQPTLASLSVSKGELSVTIEPNGGFILTR